MADTSAAEPEKQIATIIEVAAKGVAVASAFSLMTAFLFTWVKYTCLDGRLLSYFSLSDHVQTATSLMPAMAIFLAFNALLSRYSAKLTLRLLKGRQDLGFFVFAALMLAGIAMMLFVAFTVPQSRVTLGITTVVGVGIAISLARLRGSPRRRLAALAAWVWFGGTMYVASYVGTVIADADRFTGEVRRNWFSDVVTLKDNGTVVGHVLIALERGVIVQTQQPIRYRFISKESVVQVDSAPSWKLYEADIQRAP